MKTLVMQVIFGFVLLVVSFGYGATYVSDFLDNYGVDWSAMRWPVMLIAFDFLALPALLLGLFLADVLFHVGLLRMAYNVLIVAPLTAIFSTFGQGELARTVSDSGYTMLMDFLGKVIKPPAMKLLLFLGIVPIGYCIRSATGDICSELFDPSISLFGYTLRFYTKVPLPSWIPYLVLFLWMIFTAIISLPRVVSVLLEFLKVILRFFFFVFRVLVEMIIYIILLLSNLLSRIESLSRLVSALANVVTWLRNLLVKLEAVLLAIINILSSIVVHSMGLVRSIVSNTIGIIIILIRYLIFMLLVIVALPSDAWRSAVFLSTVMLYFDTTVIEAGIIAVLISIGLVGVGAWLANVPVVMSILISSLFGLFYGLVTGNKRLALIFLLLSVISGVLTFVL